MISRSYSLFGKVELVVSGVPDSPIARYFDDELNELRVADGVGGRTRLAAVSIREKVAVPGHAVLLQSNFAYATPDALYVLCEGRAAALRINGGGCSAEISPGFSPGVAFHIVECMLRALLAGEGVVLAHACAFRLRGRTFAVGAFGGTGKTNLLLDVLGAGGEYLADDLVAFERDGTLIPYRKRINLLHYNFAYRRDLLRKIPGTRGWFRLMRLLETVEGRGIYRTLRLYKLMAVAKNRLCRHVDVRLLAGPVPEAERCRVDRFLWLERSREPTGPYAVTAEYFVGRMDCCLKFESRQIGLWMDYLALIAPEAGRAEALQHELLTEVAGRVPLAGLNKADGGDALLFEQVLVLAQADG